MRLERIEQTDAERHMARHVFLADLGLNPVDIFDLLTTPKLPDVIDQIMLRVHIITTGSGRRREDEPIYGEIAGMIAALELLYTDALGQRFCEALATHILTEELLRGERQP